MTSEQNISMLKSLHKATWYIERKNLRDAWVREPWVFIRALQFIGCLNTDVNWLFWNSV